MLLDIENINFAPSQFELDNIFLSGNLQTTSKIPLFCKKSPGLVMTKLIC